MRLKILVFLFSFSVFFTLTIKDASSGGIFLTNGYTQVAPTSLKAAIVFDGEKETILESVTFNHNPLVVWTFIWLVPVPSEPKVEFVYDEFFNKIESLTQPKFKKNTLLEKILYFDILEEKNIPPSVFTRDIDLIKYEVFGPDKNIIELERVFSEMGYLIPKSAYNLIQKYQEMGWYLIAAEVNALHIQINATDSLNVYGASTLPIKITFKTNKPIYPLKFTSIPVDIDSRQIPISFDYGSSSEQVLGEEDENVDSLLSNQSKNQFPFLPLDYSNLKIELFVFSEKKAQVDGFTTIFADNIDKDSEYIDSKGVSYLKVPRDSRFLTRLYSYRPLLQLEDLEIKSAPENSRVNPQIRTKEKVIRAFFLLGFLVVASYLLGRKAKFSI